MGRHGGINILHQKSWHVWRMDNRLRVERDELQHAAQERERKAEEDRKAFRAKVATLRQQALGECAEEAAAPETSRSSSSTTLAAPAAGPPAAASTGRARAADRENSYKHGAVTLSNLKLAERDMDLRLKSRAAGKEVKGGGEEAEPERARSYWGAGDLGSGRHINLFEAAEREKAQHSQELEKQIRYTERNNELLEKSKRRPFSEFDEVANNVPWYARAPAQALASQHDDQGRSRCPKRRWSQRHGQTVLAVKNGIGAAQLPDSGAQLQIEDACALKDERLEGGSEAKPKRRRAKDGMAGEDMLVVLRQQREERERTERARAALLVRGVC